MSHHYNPEPHTAFNEAIRRSSAALGLMCALLLLCAVCSFFTRGAFANLLLLAIAFGGAIAGWTGYRQEQPQNSIFFGKMHLAQTAGQPPHMIDPAYGLIAMVALVVGLCLF